MKKLSYYLKQHIPGYLFAILSMVIAVSLDLLTPQVTRHIVDDVLVGSQMGKLKYLLLAILLIGIGRCIFSVHQGVYLRQNLLYHRHRHAPRFIRAHSVAVRRLF